MQAVAQTATAASAPVSQMMSTASASALSAGPVSFAMPLALAGLLSLPLLWYLMRMTPPTPRLVRFPQAALLDGLKSEEKVPDRVPLWLRLLRLSAAAGVIAAMAQPMLNPEAPLEGEGPVLVVVDNGWASASNWSARVSEMNSLIDRAERENREIMMLAMAAPGDDSPIRLTQPMTAAEARHMASTMTPQPWPVDREAALRALDDLQVDGPVSAVWLSSGLNSDSAFELGEYLQTLGTLTMVEDTAENMPLLLNPPQLVDGRLSLTVQRMENSDRDSVSLSARDIEGRLVEQVVVRFEPGATEATATFDLPPELRSDLARISIDGERSAGAVVLLDEQWRHRPVGLLETQSASAIQPLLNELNYIEQALSPYTDLRRGGADALLARDQAVMVLADAAPVDEPTRQQIDRWIRDGGTLLRFAGPRMAGQDRDDLLPVPLRQGGRTLGGGMSWSTPARLAPFTEDSPFYGLQLPEDVVIERQVLAEPGAHLDERTWARLEDGTPLVTAERRGEGWLVLVHTTANADWSNLAFSGLYVDMLRAIVDHSRGLQGGAGASGLQPMETLNAQGQLTSPPLSARPLTREAIAENQISAHYPPGLYGNDTARRAHNLGGGVTRLEAMPPMPEGAHRQTYVESRSMDLTGPLLVGSLALMILDQLVALGYRRRQNSQSKPQGQDKKQAPQPAP